MFPEPQLAKSEKHRKTMCDSSCGNPTCRGTPTESPTAKKARKGLGRFEGGAFPSDSLSLYMKWSPHQKT